jgi:hypothetical protein
MSILVVSEPIFQRAMRVISSITNAYPAVVTTTTDHQYITGMIIRLNIPKGFGMQQANQKFGKIIVTGDTTFSIDIDTTGMDQFLSLISLGNTNGSGNISGTISTNVVPLEIGQSFFIGEESYLTIVDNGALYSDGDGSGTFDVSTGVYSITGAPASTAAYFTQVLYPLSLQYAQCTPIGELNSMLDASTQNVLGTGFYD